MTIIDMEMPKDCYACKLTYYDEAMNKRCSKTKHVVEFNFDKREDDCPLKEVEERKISKWVDNKGFIDINKTYREYTCSNCNSSIYEKPYQIKHHKYCLHCGAEMRGAENEN